ncbi:oxytocin receptor-like isoform X2 [Photinus pyralis]|uniref:oxytocin receptor-like isoform X2 n=1 Tax=Photinus pyralis TaxID=7054 RepID=UPI001267789C|nr:oxytocin receptor-like isoform X2 [Photinus pyralis]XP_031349294.1 oxytocin receptor-like isoform X2 [Photinus pyralis]
MLMLVEHIVMNGTIENITRSGPTVDVENTTVDRDENLAKIEIATLAIIFLVTVLGNGTVLLALWTRRRYAGRKKLSRMYFFILHLSVADLITAFLSVLPQLGWEVTYRFNGGVVLCKVVKFGQTLGPYLSAYILMATAIDRHQAICYPLTYCSWTSRRSKVMVWLAWAASLTFCIPQLTIFAYQEVGPGVYDCWATFPQPWGAKAYVTWYGISVFIVPLLVLIVTYSCICREIWRSSAGELGQRQRQNHQPKPLPGKKGPLISRAKINTVKQTVAVIVMHIVCSTPFISAQLWATWDPLASESPFLEGPAFTILTLLYSLNSCVNPWIYLAFNRELPRLLLRHYTASNKNYRTTETGVVETTSLRPFTRWSLCNNSRNAKSSGRPLQRHYGAQYNARRWVVTTAT